ncbi:hypothetical protein [Kordiimonas laminariae]|uniref:hypothetical protein n=1 Tax=Kordiimonas laminariae TaxID=2917717 RepID=UPI001FF4FA01|nr:hypothetical protein [Kordiimonas laminariae]MCK0068358.1 hypothetical protein [Kordiimonas laminariae]
MQRFRPICHREFKKNVLFSFLRLIINIMRVYMILQATQSRELNLHAGPDSGVNTIGGFLLALDIPPLSFCFPKAKDKAASTPWEAAFYFVYWPTQ